MLFFPDTPQTSRYGRGIAGYDAGSGKQIQRGAFYQEANSRAAFEAAGSSRVTKVLGVAFDQLVLKRGLGCSLFAHTGDTEAAAPLSARVHVKSFVQLQFESGSGIILSPRNVGLTLLKCAC